MVSGESAIGELIPGQIIFGRYRVIKCLGLGSIGAVFACENITDTRQKIALKVLSPKAAVDSRIVNAFKNEIHASYRVSHSNVVRCHEFFRDGNMMAISMEYVDGQSLGKFIQTHGVLPHQTVKNILIQLCKGLSAIHGAGIIHQDLKPQNIIITPDGRVKITDFTAAHLHRQNKVDHEDDGVYGTLEFLSPETVMYGSVDERSDIYALGTVAYLMITGKLPFLGKDMVSEIQNKLYGSAVPPHIVNTECPTDLSKVIMKALSRNPQKRFQSAYEFHDSVLTGYVGNTPSMFQRILSIAGFNSNDAKVVNG
jgi:eukaryotic-like serine/threonine-protein kinase